ERTPSQDLVDEHVVHERDAGAAGLARKMEGPVAEGLRAGLYDADGRRIRGAAGLHAPAAPTLERVHVLLHEAADAVAERRDLGRNGEVHQLALAISVVAQRRKSSSVTTPTSCASP